MKRLGLLVGSCALALVACGDNLAAPPDAAPPGPDAPPPFAEAGHPGVPQVASEGGSVLATPKVVPIFFAGDPAQPDLEAFLAALAPSSYWPATTAEYGVGSLAIEPSVVSTDTPPTTDTALQTWLAAQFPAPDPSTIYTVFLPAGVVLTQGNSKSCVAFGGYHYETTAGGMPLVYALVPRCTTTTLPGPLDEVTVATSHELIEAATDPHPATAPAYDVVDIAHLAWNRTPGGELGDMCEYLQNAPQPLVGSYYVQRSWSNASAAAGHDPCVPAMPAPYLGAAPVLPDVTITLRDGTQVTTQGLTVNLNQSQTIEVDLFSDAPSDDYTVEVLDARQFQGQHGSFEFFWDSPTGQNGAKRHVLVTRTVAGNGRPSEIGFFVTKDSKIVSQWWAYVTGQ